MRRNAATSASPWALACSGRSSATFSLRNASFTSITSVGNFRALISAAMGRVTALPASSWASTLMPPRGAFHGRASMPTRTPESAAPAGKAGKKSPPAFTPTREAPFARKTTSPPPPWAR
jgi:hypothetical protein